MKLLTFSEQGAERLGVKTEQGILDVAAASVACKGSASVPQNIHQVIEGGAEAVEALYRLEGEAISRAAELGPVFLDEAELTFAPAVTSPGKILCIGLNYRKHAEESNAAIPEVPILFSKFNNTLAAHGEAVPLPIASEKVDYEAELAIVIGKEAKHVTEEEALSYVFGYCAANDLSARDLQMRTGQWLLGKTCDKFAPLGPYLVTADEVGNPNELDMKCIVNGEVRQHSNTSDMIFSCKEIVSYVSRHMTLLPGDVILTGTPEGVMLGYPEDKQSFLKAGDRVTIEIEKLGSLTNLMIREQ
ncbi:fumarylacetoacetate hydrolase family protein [Paenibacillus sp. Leaf72]|uniref:fumarylacetoacetate hydrolase family protein n=1 Tax=Paenibacillus sp. Leaf72 TaxID=1736234 RepID=UPI0006FF76FD|nr:fumarylacetoacetate hydrolase family protein [Paenibacillus sp. Leaf72]KQO01397.1 5-carboxymethyl-2-hydroxymuconate isomerase [Paenibacillus sp. Leaf72]